MGRQRKYHAGPMFSRLVNRPLRRLREWILRRLAAKVSTLLLESRATKPATALCVGLAYDPTNSVRLTTDHVEMMVSLCRTQDCRMAFTRIGEIAKPLQTVKIEPIEGKLTKRLRVILRNELQLEAWRADIAPAILTKRKPVRKDLYGALLRLELFFAQDNHARKILILLSDCTHMGPERLLPPFTEDVTILVVGADHETARWVFGENVVTLDDMESALEILKLKTRR